MKKVILFLWFGDEKPPYIQWTLENFKQMNPGWEIKYIEYSNEQLKDYKEQGDPVLAATTPNKCFSFWVDDYKIKYLTMHKDELVIYSDLDCFPIAPFDNFIIEPSRNYPEWAIKDALNGNNCTRFLGYWVASCENLFIQRDDLWCIGNNSNRIGANKFLMIHKDLYARDDITIVNSIFINKGKLPDLEQRNKDFHEMKIQLGDNFCLPQFTPVEHYQSLERFKLNIPQSNLPN